MLAKSLGCNFIEADDYHSQANKEKMSRAIPLNDEDRVPWLEALSGAIRKYMMNGETLTLTCSALQNKYREILRSADPNYKPGNYTTCRVKFVCLVAPAEVIAERIKIRSNDGKHFMPATLLQSQLDLLQINEDEQINKIDATLKLQSIVDSILLLIKGLELQQ
ncbi:gluconokinase isoform X2 [Dioscorea cayenensis subsp. rotundata]|nr:gluconokinase isoform X2 [Dioscorea cayenensis subsp. rotundata]XP_039135274.1 gluconokinase isoform X2 [Dioscorea cayenensis subsp. rotundata]